MSKKKATSKTLRHYRDSYSRARLNRRGWKASKATRERDYYALTGHILPIMGDWLVREVTLADLENVVDHWMSKTKGDGTTYPNTTVNVWIKVARLYMRYCCKMEGVGSPADDLDYLVTKESERGTALTAEQTAQFLAHMKALLPQWYAMCVLGFSTGLRFSTLSALRWSDIDYDDETICFEQSQYHGVAKVGDKTGKVIYVPLIDEFADVLVWHRRYLMEREHPGLSTGLVFPSIAPDGALNGYLAASGLRNAMASVCDELTDDLRENGDDPSATFPRITAHDMRYTFISQAFGERVDRHVIKATAGQDEDSMNAKYDKVSRSRMAQGIGQVVRGYQITG